MTRATMAIASAMDIAMPKLQRRPVGSRRQQRMIVTVTAFDTRDFAVSWYTEVTVGISDSGGAVHARNYAF